MTSQFKEKNSDLWKWVLYCALSAFIIVVGWSINHMTPGLLPIALAMCAAGLGVSFVYTVYTTHRSGALRWRAWVCEALIVVGLALQVVIHAGLSRRYDVATQARQARFIEEGRAEQRKQLEQNRRTEEARNQAALMERQADLLARQKQLTDAQSRQLGMVRSAERRLLPPPAPLPTMPEAPVAPLAAATPLLGDGLDAPKQPVAILTPEQVQEQAWWAVLLGILTEVGVIVGTFVFFVRGLIADKNGNNVADWKEELSPEELKRDYPEDYRRLHGGQQAPGFAPATLPAQAKNEAPRGN